MKKALSVLALVFCICGSSAAADMKGKVGLGIRNDDLSMRYFISNSFAVDAAVSYQYIDRDGSGISDGYALAAGGLYNKEIYSDIMLQTGALLLYSPGRNAGKPDKQYGINPFFGAEILIKDHFGLDFKIIPFGFIHYDNGSGTSQKTITSMMGSFGAHIYF